MTVATYPIESSVASYFYPSLAHHLMGHRVGEPRDTWIPVKVAADHAVLRLAYALRGFLQTAERDLCPQWPHRTPGIPQYVADASVEYRAEIKKGRR